MLNLIKDIVFSIAIIMMLYGGLIFTKRYNFIQFNLKKIVSSCMCNNSDISPIKTLMMSLAAKIGVGSLAGVALAIYFGGPGTIFWMWIISLLTSPNTYVESILGKKYQEKDGAIHKGGPSYYIEKGLKNRKLGIIYSILLIFTFIVGFNTIQSNTIADIIGDTYNIPYIITGILLGLITLIIIIKNDTKIINFISKLVPFMTFFYIIVFLYISIKNINSIIPVFRLIISSAFNCRAFGASVITTIIIGMQRGIFTTEAGLGTSAIAASITDDSNKEKIGYIQMFGVNFTSLFICTSTAIIVLLSNYEGLNLINPNGIELTKYAFNYHLGNLGNIFLIVVIFLFAFSTIVSGYYYGESGLKFFYPQISGKSIFVFKVLTVLMIIIGSVLSPTILWNIADIFVAMLGIINMYAILKLKI